MNPLSQLRPPDESALEIDSDPRWQLVERILQTGPFQKSAYLPGLLRYLTEQAIQGKADTLTERQIGIAVFGKAPGYKPAEDSAVRVHVRQLRLRLHEYFDQEGHNESLRIEIPKGSYAVDFVEALKEPQPLLVSAEAAKSSHPSHPATPTAEPARRRQFGNLFSWFAVAAAVICAVGWFRSATTGAYPSAPWPLNTVIQPNRQTRVVVSDSTLTLRLLGDQGITLDEYLQPDFRKKLIPPHLPKNIERLLDYVSDSQLSSYADLAVVATLVKFAGSLNSRLLLTSARDLDRRDLDQGNCVFVGSPTSNPWVTLFADKLNFQEVEESVGGPTHFVNRKPLPGEAKEYEGLATTGSTGEDYATISVLPSPMGLGNVMILQGLRQEGTEALSAMLADAGDRELLENTVKKGSKPSQYFEALIRSRALAGAPVSVDIVAVRTIQP
jgi:hypothetical protein